MSQWGRYKNGVYGYDIGVPPGWTLHKASETNEYAFFSAPDLGGTNEVWTEDPGGSPTLESLAEARRSKLTTQARDKSWPVFEIVSDRKIAAGGGEFYEIVFRRQVGDGYCTSLVIERLHLVSLYPRGLDRISPALWAGALSIFAGDRSSDKHSYQVGVVTRASVCESHLGAYLAITETFQDSFSVWNRYWDDNYGYGLNVPPGWSAQQIYGGSTFTAPDQSAVVEVTAHYYSLNETVEALKAWRLGEYREYANEWTSFESKGNIQRLCRPGRVICLPSYYLAEFKAQFAPENCIMDYSELMGLSSYHPNSGLVHRTNRENGYPYGFLLTASVCENSPYAEDSREMLAGFRY